MAGRGTDIQLGGNVDMLVRQSEPEITAKFPDEAERKAELERVAAEIRAEVARNREIVLEAGGLFVIGTERHESRRIDNQLRGRSGRQGDPGASKFFLSLEDDLMRIFGTDKVLDWVPEEGPGRRRGDRPIRWINKALEKAQEKVEARNFEIRKNLLRFDDVMNDQRKVIYEQRIELMGDRGRLGDRRRHAPRRDRRRWSPAPSPRTSMPSSGRSASSRRRCCASSASTCRSTTGPRKRASPTRRSRRALNDAVDRLFAEKAAQYGPEVMRQVEKSVLMQLLDQSWKEHLLHLDHLRQGIGLRAYGQKDPLNEYKREAFNLFNDLLTGLREQVVSLLATLQLRMEPPPMPEMPAQHAGDPRGSGAGQPAMSDDPGLRSGRSGRRRRRHAARVRAAAQAGARPQRSRDLGQGRAQRALPLRLGQEVQALPRPGLTSVRGGRPGSRRPAETTSSLKVNFRNSRSHLRWARAPARDLIILATPPARERERPAAHQPERRSAQAGAGPLLRPSFSFPQFAQRVLRAAPD